jgi:hypothetical protein
MYYKMGKINEKERGAYYEYTIKQASKKMSTSGTHGPWDIDLSLEEKFDRISKYKLRLTSKERAQLKNG